MASIILSFIGSQDPYSDKNQEEGSLVTLIRHLITQGNQLRKLFFLFTQDTQAQAELTKDWLQSELSISEEIIELISVSDSLSEDPVDVKLAINEARHYLSIAVECRQKDDIIDFNSSSGTPAMKTAWGILQASGYGGKSRLWQVRNPSKMKDGQSRVFENNVNVFKNESDLKVIKKQLQNYNYDGASKSLENSDFEDDSTRRLMELGFHRLAFNFDQAFTSLQALPELEKKNWITDISQLRQKQTIALLKEVYYKAEIDLKKKQYADFLILVFCFQENLLRYLVKKMILSPTEVNKNWRQLEKQQVISRKVNDFDQGKLSAYLKEYRLKGGDRLKINYSSRLTLKAILEYNTSQYLNVLPSINYLETYCDQRNDYIHNLEGVSEIPESQTILNKLADILSNLSNFSKTNPFDTLNEQILSHLTLVL